ncbi:hypothetical protein ACFP1L_12515 [Lactiplantibacillus nangangensis]|uniref:Uncharacterized protein n=4 Tax=Lactobacillaceae TaxID=33958 RepID=A0A1L6XCQ8_9LACO|nr:MULTISPECIES: hypothetical protein [Lactobacillaceae]APT18775.1 hypothetical protein LA20533_05660 [Amylolactobacillus amylophilus DSM 20533 = JCM 1125]KRK36688.1 hypothetical protein FC62_GL000618 [Amylolactobacillus amylotrophicus DSM 20534]KRM43484.1 hypothetical protein FD40_GL001572 [Amylolactobacillus amylophilus DSM 20533 = JCM 1125]GED81024.1 hypothetical protein LAM01_14970 [Amylolactobacillus amylophilus]
MFETAFKKTTKYVFTTISSTIKKRKEELNLNRSDILSDESLVSNIINNKRTTKYPNLMSDFNAQDIRENLKFNNLDEMLWGQIKWNVLLKKAINEIYSYKGTDLTMINLHELLFQVLTANVHFAQMRAGLSYDIYPVKVERKKSRTINTVKIEALDELSQRIQFLNAESFQEILVRRFEEEFFGKEFRKFYVRFPKLMQTIFTDILTPLKPTPTDTGMLAYYLTINAYEAFEAESRAWYQDDNRMRNEYARVSTELDTAIGAMQKVHRYEMSLFPQKNG